MTVIPKQKVASEKIYNEEELRTLTRWQLKALARGRGYDFKGDNKNPPAADLVEFCLAWQEQYQNTIPDGEPVSEKTAAKIAEAQADETPGEELLPPSSNGKGKKTVHTKDLSARMDKILKQVKALNASFNERYDRLENQNRMLFLLLQEVFKLAGDEADLEGIIDAISNVADGTNEGNG